MPLQLKDRAEDWLLRKKGYSKVKLSSLQLFTLTMVDMRLSAEEKWKRCRIVAVSFSAPLCFGLETQPAVCVHPAFKLHIKNCKCKPSFKAYETALFLLKAEASCIGQHFVR